MPSLVFSLHQKTLLSTEKNLYIIAGVANLNYCKRYKPKEAKDKDNAMEINWTDFILPNSKPQRPDLLLSKVGTIFNCFDTYLIDWYTNE